jgi:hypothetical protein
MYTTTPKTNMASPKMKRDTSLNSTSGMKFNFSVHRSVRKVEKGSFADEICGQIRHSVAKSAITPITHKIMLRAWADFCLRRIFIIYSQL